MPVLTEEEITRYRRQIIIPEIGEEGQKKLKQAKVLVVGCGGLGSVITFYLAAMGIGEIRIVDKDRVELSNLNRQIIHFTDDIGKKKVESAIEKLCRLNPNVKIEGIHLEFDETIGEEIARDSNVIADALDNLRTRRVLNRISQRLRIPYVYGGVDGLNGMITTFVPGETACFECVFPFEKKSKEEIGVVGPLPGIIASLQALEVLKLILGMEGVLKNRLLFFSGYDMRFSEIRLSKNPSCPCCGGSC